MKSVNVKFQNLTALQVKILERMVVTYAAADQELRIVQVKAAEQFGHRARHAGSEGG
jgi:hypothetical protein